MTSGASNKNNKSIDVYVWGWVIIIVALFLIVQPFSLYFLNDDFIYVSKSIQLQYLYRTAFRPVSDLSLLLNQAISGTASWSYHFTNIAFHGLATRLVFVFIKRLYMLHQWPKAALVAHLAAAFFWCFPFHSESIFWIIGRGGSMVTILFLASMLCIMHRQNSIGQWIAAGLFFVTGLFTYESSWLIPAAIGIWLIYFYKHPSAIPKTDKAGWVMLMVLLILSFFVRYLLIGHFIGSPYLNTNHFQFNFVKQLYKYSTGFFRSFLPPMQSSTWFVAMMGLLMIALYFAIKTTVKRLKFWGTEAMLTLLFLLCLSPVSILGVSTHTTESERFLYLPSAFLCMLLAVWLMKRVSFFWLQRIVPGIIVIMLIGLISASVPYKLASQWTKATMAAIAQHPGTYHAMVATNVPTNYKGGFMFRLGLEEGSRWLAPDVQFDSLIILSSRSITNNMNLQTNNLPPFEWPAKPPRFESRKILHLYWQDNVLHVAER